MPAPSDSDIDALRERCFAIISEGGDPVGHLTADEQNLLMTLHISNSGGAAALLVQLREHARLAGWPAYRIHRLSFTLFVEGAREVRRIERERRAEERRSNNVVNMRTRRPTRQYDPNPPSLVTPEDLIAATTSPRANGIGHLLAALPQRLWYDTFHHKVFSNWNCEDDLGFVAPREIDDDFISRTMSWLYRRDTRLGIITPRQIQEWISAAAHHDERNELTTWLNGLVWDGEPRLDSLMTVGYGAADSEFNRAVGHNWLVSLVARALRPGCEVHTMPVFIGPQGALKSRSLKTLGGDWYSAVYSSIDSKDFLQELQGAWLVEIPELHSLMASRAGAAKIKAVISQSTDRFRLPYGILVQSFPRTCVLSGTTNNRGWHSDDTGGRRFWPIHVGVIDLDWLALYRDQLFAEAAMCYTAALAPDADPDTRARGQWWIVPADAQRALIDAETPGDIRDDIIAQRLADPGLAYSRYDGPQPAAPAYREIRADMDWGNIITTERIAYSWLGLTAEQAQRPGTAKRIREIMNQNGWENIAQRVRGMTATKRIWLNESAQHAELMRNAVTAVTSATDDEPAF